ncbi:MAG: hypothetical protein INQ03_24045 [Candidatus Heimdallarchaeota archaeon]|nr:hypothetical protein [Candidatus Heimdallarchaeota archaeon]
MEFTKQNGIILFFASYLVFLSCLSFDWILLEFLPRLIVTNELHPALLALLGTIAFLFISIYILLWSLSIPFSILKRPMMYFLLFGISFMILPLFTIDLLSMSFVSTLSAIIYLHSLKFIFDPGFPRLNIQNILGLGLVYLIFLYIGFMTVAFAIVGV